MKAAADNYSVVGNAFCFLQEKQWDKVTTDESGTAISKPLYMGKYTVDGTDSSQRLRGYSKSPVKWKLKEGDAQKTAVFQNEETLDCINKVSKKEK